MTISDAKDTFSGCDLDPA